jgi:hypothetical protein
MSVTIDIDLRDRIGAVRDQGQRPTCLVFAVSAAHEAKRPLSEYLSVEYLFYGGALRSHKDPEQGLTRDAVRDALMNDGQPPELVWPYSLQTPKASGWEPPALKEPAHRATIEYSFRTSAEVRELVKGGTPVLLVVSLSIAMYTPDERAIIRSRTGDTVTTRRHALLAVGTGHAEDGYYLLVRNSWGSTWGDAGHGWLHEPYLSPHLQMTGIIT